MLVEFQVSSIALAHIVSTNPGLYCLEAKGCRNLFQQKSKMEDRDIPSFQYSCEEWCNELAKTCKLEEIALGWGFSCCSLEALKPAIATLKVVTVGLGASLGQDAVELLPTICPLLEEVILYFQVPYSRDSVAVVHHPFPECKLSEIWKIEKNLVIMHDR